LIIYFPNDIFINKRSNDMAGKIFYRERRKVGKGKKKPRFAITAVYKLDLSVTAEHFKKSELEQIAAATGSELVLLTSKDKSHKYGEEYGTDKGKGRKAPAHKEQANGRKPGK
jgi:hypothetical protein